MLWCWIDGGRAHLGASGAVPRRPHLGVNCAPESGLRNSALVCNRDAFLDMVGDTVLKLP